jgi:hypothetical protein
MSFEISIKHPNSLNFQTIEQRPSKWVIYKDIDINNWLDNKMKRESWTSYMLYNDDSPVLGLASLPEANKSKGILLWNKYSVSWLIHSIPKWPLKLFDPIPKSEEKYVHTFVFMTFNIIQLPNIIEQLKLMQLNIYETNNYSFVSRKRAPTIDKSIKIINLGKNIYHIAKHNKATKNLFTDILIETYGNKKDGIIYKCRTCETNVTDNRIENIDTIYLNNEIIDNVIDKSKWAISSSIENPWICISDLNNTINDNTKSGGGIVIINKELWELMMKLC